MLLGAPEENQHLASTNQWSGGMCYTGKTEKQKKVICFPFCPSVMEKKHIPLKNAMVATFATASLAALANCIFQSEMEVERLIL